MPVFLRKSAPHESPSSILTDNPFGCPSPSDGWTAAASLHISEIVRLEKNCGLPFPTTLHRQSSDVNLPKNANCSHLSASPREPGSAPRNAPQTRLHRHFPNGQFPDHGDPFFSRAESATLSFSGILVVLADVRRAPHLVIWALLAGSLGPGQHATIYASASIG